MKDLSIQRYYSCFFFQRVKIRRSKLKNISIYYFCNHNFFHIILKWYRLYNIMILLKNITDTLLHYSSFIRCELLSEVKFVLT